MVCVCVIDMTVRSIKTGMLGTKETVVAVAEAIAAQNASENTSIPLVVDPVLVATSGDSLAKENIVEDLVEHLFGLATIITPNIPEAETLLGWPRGEIRTRSDQIRAAKELHKLGLKWVLVKGGHMETDASKCVDVLYDGSHVHELESKRIVTRNTHGTGCTLASAIACGLAGGLEVLPSVKAAVCYLSGVIENSRSLSIGGNSTSTKQGPGVAPAQGSMHHQVLRSGWKPDLKSQANYRLYAVTDSKINRKNERDLVTAVCEAVKGGATIVQLREKDASTSSLVSQAKAVIKVCRPLGIPVIINDRVDVAIAVDADGVHVGDDDMPVRTARKMIGPLKILGVSVKTPEQAMQAERDGADYVGAGACFSTSTKADSTLIGLEMVQNIHTSAGIPVVAIGGISHSNAEEVLRKTSVEGLAVVSSIFDSQDIALRCKEMRDMIDPFFPLE